MAQSANSTSQPTSLSNDHLVDLFFPEEWQSLCCLPRSASFEFGRGLDCLDDISVTGDHKVTADLVQQISCEIGDVSAEPFSFCQSNCDSQESVSSVSYTHLRAPRDLSTSRMPSSS